MRPNYSIVIPVCNEVESLDILLGEITNELKSLVGLYEIIFVDDGSNDGTKEKLDQFKKSYPSFVLNIHLPERKGQTRALQEGLGAAKGEYVITLDADLQDDPHDIGRLVEKISEGYDVVCGWRKTRRDKFLKKVLSKLGNWLGRLISGLPIHDISCTLRIYRWECLKKLDLAWEGQHRFIPLILFKKGFKIEEMVSNHRERRFGNSKYNHKRIFKVIADFFKVLKRNP